MYKFMFRRYYYDKNIMTKVHGKRYAYKFDFQGLAAATQPATGDPAAYKYQSDLFMSAGYHHSAAKLNFMSPHAGIPSTSGKYLVENHPNLLFRCITTRNSIFDLAYYWQAKLFVTAP